MMEPDKSVLDNVPVVENKEAKKLFGKAKSPPRPKDLVIVSYCKQCGCPIYGLPKVPQGDVPPTVRTCTCKGLSGTLSGTMQTK